MMSISGYDGWKTASPYDADSEWEEPFDAVCENELSDDNFCEWAGELEATCVGGDGDYTRYWKCPDCGLEYADEVRG